jgi:polyhydroxybutyrate depolymerase
MRRWLYAIGVAAAPALVWCGGSSATDAPPPADDAEPEPDAAQTADRTAPPPPPGLDAGADDAPSADAPSLGCGAKTGKPGEIAISLPSEAGTRTATLHVPAIYDATRAVPLLLAFHGFTENGAGERARSHFDLLADTQGFLVAFPDGISNSWNGGACCGLAMANKVDDIGFARALVAKISEDYCVDPKRVFAAGFSNGGFLSHRIGCEASDVFAAVAAVSGDQTTSPCAPPRPVSVVQIHGTADPIVPYNGSALLGFPPVADSIGGWATRDTCAATTHETLRDGSAHCSNYDGCPSGSEVILCTIDGFGHDWPGTSGWDGSTPPPGFVASTYILDFFGRHPLP